MLLALLLLPPVLGQGGRWQLTPLLNRKHLCTAEALMSTQNYICNDEGEVICLFGWSNPERACCDPVCDECINGECVAPHTCACEVGWRGSKCDVCVRMPGCQNGYCVNALECRCNDGWTGAFCNIPACDGCIHGTCISPHTCVCNDGWEGENCDTCRTHRGCVHGTCNGTAWGCYCEEGWSGPLCDKPECREGCHPENGFCKRPNQCLCKFGWSGENCDDCMPYWACPVKTSDGCVAPFQCICSDEDVAKANEDVCNNECINGDQHTPWSPCRDGRMTRECNWGECGALEMPCGPGASD